MVMNKRVKWTKELAYKKSLKYHSKIEFKNKAPNAYNAAHRNGWITDICSHMSSLRNKPWSKELIHEQALKYSNRLKFKHSVRGAYDAALRNGWIDDVCSHMTPLYKAWSKESIHEAALKHSNRADFSRLSGGAYNAAVRNEWLDEVCSHMSHINKTDNNVIYVWRIVNTDVCKIGVTSLRLGLSRIVEVARNMNIDYEVVLIKNINNASKLEKSLLNVIKDKVKLPKMSGSTEFRIIPSNLRNDIVNIVRCYQ